MVVKGKGAGYRGGLHPPAMPAVPAHRCGPRRMIRHGLGPAVKNQTERCIIRFGFPQLNLDVFRFCKPAHAIGSS